MTAENDADVIVIPTLNDTDLLARGAGALLGEAFQTQTVWKYTFQSPERREVALQWVIGNQFMSSDDWIQNSKVLVSAEDPSEVRGVMVLFPPNHPGYNVGDWDMIKAGMWQWPIELDWTSFSRYRNIKESIQKDMEQTLGEKSARRDYWGLECLALRPDMQRKGAGSDMLRSEINMKVDREPGSKRIVVVCQEEAAVRFFEKNGFRLLSQRNLEIGNFSFKNFILERPDDALTASEQGAPEGGEKEEEEAGEKSPGVCSCNP